MKNTEDLEEGAVTLLNDGPLAVLTLNRPSKRNALSKAMWREIAKKAGEVAADKSRRVMILRGSDARAFSAGADIEEFEKVHASPETAHAYIDDVDRAFEAVAGLEIPTIAMIQGVCFGGGCALSLCCDFRYADNNAKFCIPPAKLGLVYSLKDTKRLADLIGPAKAKEMLMTALVVDAAEAHRIGLANHLYEPEALEAETVAFAQRLAGLSQVTIGAVKLIMNDILSGTSSDTEASRRLVDGQFASPDYVEGRRAFLEKRKPVF